MLSKESFRFMSDLYSDNNKQWFDQNRKRYEQFVREPMKALANALEDPVSLIMPEFNGKAKVSRINNDIRFSPNKAPYKERVWISFGDNSNRCSNLFAGIDKEGWTTGSGIGAPKKEPLEDWHTNLLTHTEQWRSYASTIGLRDKTMIHLGNPYKKPLYPDTPEDLLDLVQARGVWIVDQNRTDFKGSAVEDVFRGICRFLPVYLFMTVKPENLMAQLSKLSTKIIAPDKEIDDIWKSLQ